MNVNVNGTTYESCTYEDSEGVYHAREGRVLTHDEYRRDFAGDCILPVRKYRVWRNLPTNDSLTVDAAIAAEVTR